MISIPLRLKRAERGAFVQKMQHAVPSIVVLGDGLSHLTDHPHGAEIALGIFEVIAALLVMVSVVRGIRTLVRRMKVPDGHHAEPHYGIDWIDIFIGVMLSVEAYAKYFEHGRIARPTILLAVTMLTVGLTHGKLAAWGDRRRELRVGPEGLSVPSGPFKRLTLAWHEVASIELDDRTALITAVDGRSKRIVLGDVMQPAPIREALMTARSFMETARHASSASIESSASAT